MVEEGGVVRRRIHGLYAGDPVINLFESKINIEKDCSRVGVLKELEGTPAECLSLNTAMQLAVGGNTEFFCS